MLVDPRRLILASVLGLGMHRRWVPVCRWLLRGWYGQAAWLLLGPVILLLRNWCVGLLERSLVFWNISWEVFEQLTWVLMY